MKKKIKINFVDYWPRNYDYTKGLIYRYLCGEYDVEISDYPDYLFCYPYERNHFNYKNCVKIFVNPENHVGDFNLYDYVVGFDNLSFGDRYERIPNYTFYSELKELPVSHENMPSDEELLNRDFCSFVVSNAEGDPIRGRFFEQLSKYKKVSSGGSYMNNVGGPIPDKGAFCSKYKFNIAFENSVSPGYTTEKLIQPFAYHTVPIYYGNPDVGMDFNLNSFIRLDHTQPDKGIADAIERIVALDQDDDAYLKMCKAKNFLHEVDYFEVKLKRFLKHIIEQPLEQAKRISPYGHLRTYNIRAERAAKFEGFFHPRIVSEIVKRRKRV